MTTGLILAGGRSKRLGVDKALISIGGKPLIERVVDVVKPIVDELIVVMRDEGTQKSEDSGQRTEVRRQRTVATGFRTLRSPSGV